MKRLSLMIHVIAVCILAGILHAGQMHQERMENVLSIQSQMTGYSENIPWVVVDPAPGVLY
jgi:hypothetical protein